MEHVNFTRYSPYDADKILTDQLIECYRLVFAEEPWNEWLICPVCGEYWGKKDAAFLRSMEFTHCNRQLRDFWPREKVLEDIQHEINQNASCWLALVENNVIGFCWGYPIGFNELQDKLEISISLSNDLILRSQTIAYQDEVGVLKEYRQKKNSERNGYEKIERLSIAKFEFWRCTHQAKSDSVKNFFVVHIKTGLQNIGNLPGQ